MSRETLPDALPSPAALASLQAALGHTWNDPALLQLALTHPGATRDPGTALLNNQRLEFLGDAILSAVLAEAIFLARPLEREGVLTSLRSSLANGKSLSRVALRLGLDQCLILHRGDTQVPERGMVKALEDALEAVFGALFLDAGWETSRRVILRCFSPLEDLLCVSLDDPNPKGRLQEIIQPVHGNSALSYELVSALGPDHDKVWKITVRLFGNVLGEGSGSTKKKAEEAAARAALAHPGLDGWVAAAKPAGH